MTEILDKNKAQGFWGVSGEKEENIGKMPNGLKISRRTLNTKRNKEK